MRGGERVGDFTDSIHRSCLSGDARRWPRGWSRRYLGRERSQVRAARSRDGRRWWKMSLPNCPDHRGKSLRLYITARTSAMWWYGSISQGRHDCAQRRGVNRARDPHPSPGRELNLDRAAGLRGRRQWLPVRRNGDWCIKDFIIVALHRLRPAGEDARARLPPPNRNRIIRLR